MAAILLPCLTMASLPAFLLSSLKLSSIKQAAKQALNTVCGVCVVMVTVAVFLCSLFAMDVTCINSLLLLRETGLVAVAGSRKDWDWTWAGKHLPHPTPLPPSLPHHHHHLACGLPYPTLLPFPHLCFLHACHHPTPTPTSPLSPYLFYLLFHF